MPDRAGMPTTDPVRRDSSHPRQALNRSRLAAVLVIGLSFFGGGGLGSSLAAWLAPASAIAAVVGLLMLPAAMIAGYHTWLGAAIVLSLPRLLRHLIAGERAQPLAQAAPPGAWTFMPVASVAGAAGGLLTGLLTQAALFQAMVLYWLVGTAYGLALWRLARAGHLPFPDGD